MLKLINWLHDTFGIGKDAAANILVTIFTFSAGILITLIFKWVSNYFIRRNHRKLLKINLLNLLKGIYKQTKAYEELTLQLIIDHIGAFSFAQKSISAIDLFKQLGYKDLYSSCFNGIENWRLFNRTKKQVAFNNIWAVLEYLNVFHQRSFDEIEKFLTLNLECNEARNQALGQAHRIVETIRLTLHGEQLNQDIGQYFRAIEEIIVNLRQQDNQTNARIMNEFFVQRILELNRQNVDVLKNYGAIINPVELNSHLLDATVRYESQKNLIDAYNFHFKYLAAGFNEQYQKIKEAYRTFFLRRKK